MSFLEFIQQNWSELLVLTREHVFLVFISTGAAILLGLPLGILLTRVKYLQTPILGVANIMQTIPSLALFGLLIPIPFIGGIGAKTAIITLALYSFLPVIRNTVTGISGVDARTREAATAMGMTDWQILRHGRAAACRARHPDRNSRRGRHRGRRGNGRRGGRRGRSGNLYFSGLTAKR